MADETIPCIPLPEAKTIKLPLPFKAELRSLIDISKPPSDCAVAQSLMLQITPLLASMACLIKVLKVLQALKGTVESAFTKTGDLLTALTDLAGCFLLFDPCEISRMIAAILRVLIGYLNCMIQAVESVLNFQVGIDLDAAGDNPVLLGALQCAQDNSQAALMNLSQALEGIQPLLDIAGTMLELVGLPPLDVPPLEASTPTLGSLTDKDPLAPVKALRDGLQAAHDALPCK
jgi:hypothetical protein